MLFDFHPFNEEDWTYNFDQNGKLLFLATVEDRADIDRPQSISGLLQQGVSAKVLPDVLAVQHIPPQMVQKFTIGTFMREVSAL